MKPALTALLALHTIFVGCSGLGSTFSSRTHIDELRDSLDAVFSDSVFNATAASLIVGSMETGAVLYERNSELLMRPASNMKLLTSAAALHYLGTAFTFSTVLYSDTLPSNGIIPRDLIIKGFGNPDLTTADLDSLVSQLKAIGVREVRGNVVVDVSYFSDDYWGKGWMWDDEPEPDEAFITALAVNDNCVEVIIFPGPSPRDPAIVSVNPPTSYVTVACEATTSEDTARTRLKVDRLYRERLNTITVSGTIPVGRRAVTRKVTVWKPELYAGTLFKERLERDSIRVGGTVVIGATPPEAVVLGRHEWPLDSMVINLNKTSDNLSAECTLRALAAELTGDPGSAETGVSMVYEFLATMGIDSTAINMVDGSGVSHYNLLTTRMIYDLLQAMGRRQDIFHAYYASLPVAGFDGSLENRMRSSSAARSLRAKTGTLSAVTSLSGYVKTSDGEILVFSMAMQSYIGPSSRYKRIEDKVGSLLAAFSRTKPNAAAP